VLRQHLSLDIWSRIDAWLDHARVESRTTHVALILVTLGLLAAVYALVYATGGTQGPYLHMAYVPILLAAVAGGARATFLTALVATLALGPLMPLDVRQGLPQAAGGWLFRGLFFVMIGLFVAAASGVLRARSRHNVELREDLAGTYSRNLRVFAGLVESRDEQTYGHCDRVGRNAVAIGRRMGLDVNVLGRLYWAGLLHDLGKIGVPEAILRKPGSLTAEEFDEVKKHCRIGHTILLNVSEDFETIADGVLSHHERWDGGGYPDGLAGEEIPLFGRIVAAADVFEALTSHRPYRDPLTNDEALAVLERGRGAHFDPDVVDAFMAAYRAGQIGLEGDPSADAQTYVDAVLRPERIGQALIAERAPWRARVVN
jgi:HD-GYP domain-containing protein (c-di-GMP phosphodiesterase class II)